MLPSFLVLGTEWPAQGEWPLAKLPAESRQHLKAQRLKPDEEFLLLNGQGRRSRVRLASASELQTLHDEILPRPRPEIQLYLSPPRGDALWESLTQATEMGATRFVFLRSQHNQFPQRQALPRERLQRVVAAACSQCGQPWLPEIHPEWMALNEALQSAPPARFVADESLAGDATKLPSTRPPACALFIGPEGGWSMAERQDFDRAQVTRLSLGPLILRVPTAVVAAMQSLRLQLH